MRILALDTATRATTVAVLDTEDGTELALRDDPEPGRRPRHTSCLMPLVTEALARVGWGWPDLDRLAVGTGPGTFTGLRIGVATARALARAREIPLIGVSSLEALALGAHEAALEGGHDIVLAVLDARRHEVFAAAWPVAAAAGSTRPPAVLAPLPLAPAALASHAAELGSSRLAIGDGAIEFRADLELPGTSIPAGDSALHRVEASFHCRLAAERVPSAAEDVRPEYLRRPDAELNLRAP
ncbi:MAG TPA: tRNA (adenosine(37)-N6)-threonylcarbamoyltransferase complex dimerization subunit type 1 TsaB [Solirubrobacteraceae bacterium]